MSETSGGTDMAALPTRDCEGEVVEKHCGRWEWKREGVKRVCRPFARNGVREKCLKQAWGMEEDMAMELELFSISTPISTGF